MIPTELRAAIEHPTYALERTRSSGWSAFVRDTAQQRAWTALRDWLAANPASALDSTRLWLQDLEEHSSLDRMSREVIEASALLALIYAPSVEIAAAWIDQIPSASGPWSRQARALLRECVYARGATAPDSVHLLGRLRALHSGQTSDGRAALIVETPAHHTYLLFALGGTETHDQWLMVAIDRDAVSALRSRDANAMARCLEHSAPLLFLEVDRAAPHASVAAAEAEWTKVPVELLPPRAEVSWERATESVTLSTTVNAMPSIQQPSTSWTTSERSMTNLPSTATAERSQPFFSSSSMVPLSSFNEFPRA